MSKFKNFLILIFACAMTMISCSKDGDDTRSYTVTFHSNGGSAVETQTVNEGGYATRPLPSIKSAEAFGGWYIDNSTFLVAFNFEATPILANVDLYAKWTSIDINALQELIEEAMSVKSTNYTVASYDVFYEELMAAQQLVLGGNATTTQITNAYNALAAAMNALVPSPHRPAVALEANISPVDGFIYVYPNTLFNVYVYAVDANENYATNDAVTFHLTTPQWMENVEKTANQFSAQISSSATIGATVELTVKSAEDPNVSKSVTIKVISAGTLKSQFIAAVNGLPDPEDITYTHGTAIEDAENLYDMLSEDDHEDEEVIAAFQKLSACHNILWNLPQRYKYIFSGNTATVSPLNDEGNVEVELVMSYVKNGNFPCGTFTSNSWVKGLVGEAYQYGQVKMELNSDLTAEMYERLAEDQNGTGASDWQKVQIGTYTNEGSQTSGGILYMSFVEL